MVFEHFYNFAFEVGYEPRLALIKTSRTFPYIRTVSLVVQVISIAIIYSYLFPICLLHEFN